MDSLQDKVQQLIDQLKEAESSLSLSENRVRTLIKVLPVALLITDENGCIEAVNSQGLELFHCQFADLIGRDLRNLFEVQNSAAESFPGAEPQEITKPIELVALTPSGRRVPVQMQLRAFSSSSSKQFLLVLEDVSRRYEIEKLKEEFVSMVTHDLRAPLTSISCFHELIASGMFDGDLELLKKKAKTSRQETSRLIGMINHLLDLNKLEAGRLEFFIKRENIRALIERALESIDALAQRKQIRIEMSAQERSPYVMADGDYIIQVLVNLLSNAIKFSPQGSTCIVEIADLPESNGAELLITVSDEGDGVSPEFRSRIFNRYEQSQVSDARIKGGSGLGLAFAKRIVDQHCGKIGLSDRINSQGSSFWFTLPVAEKIVAYENQGQPTLKPVYLERIIEDALETVETFSESLGVTLEACGTEALILADPDLLLPIVVLLLGKAVRSSARGTCISVEVELSVENVTMRFHSNNTLSQNDWAPQLGSELADCFKVLEKQKASAGIALEGEHEVLWIKFANATSAS